MFSNIVSKDAIEKMAGVASGLENFGHSPDRQQNALGR
jgi:hypothetical protein